MRAVITGAKGQLGSELKVFFGTQSKIECFFVDRLELPLDQIELIQPKLAQYQPDIVIHAGAYTAVDKAETEQELADKVNHLATAEIAKYCGQHNVKLIAISTDYVFDGNSSVALREDAPLAPINIYGLSKLRGEQAIEKWCPTAIIIRTSWVYSSFGNNFVKTMIRLMSERDEIAVINDQIGSPTYAKDLAEVIGHIIESEIWEEGIYHFSNLGEISWYDFAKAIRDLEGLECKINAIPTSQYPTPAKRPKFSLLDKTKIKNTYNLTVAPWQDSLQSMLSLLK